MIDFIGAILMPCGISDVNLPSFLQERLGFLNTDRWSDPDCCDRLSIFGRLDRESCHLAPLLCHGHGGRKNFDWVRHVRAACSLAPRRDCSAGSGRAKQPHRRPALSYARRALQHSARHEIKDFRGALLSSRPIPALLTRHPRRVYGVRNKFATRAPA